MNGGADQFGAVSKPAVLALPAGIYRYHNDEFTDMKGSFTVTPSAARQRRRAMRCDQTLGAGLFCCDSYASEAKCSEREQDCGESQHDVDGGQCQSHPDAERQQRRSWGLTA